MAESIRIRETVVRHCKYRLHHRPKYTSGEREAPEVPYILVSVSDGKETGYGEGIPTSILYPPGHMGRSKLDEWALVKKLGQGLIGKDALRLGRLIPDAARCEDANTMIDCVDFALHDLVGRRLGVPVSALLGGVAKPYVWGMPVVHTDTPDRMARKAGDWHKRFGFRYFKLKPIGTLEGDVETMRKIRERCGRGVRFCLDANYALKMDVEETIRYINVLSKLGLDMYEDPLDVDLPTFRRIRENVRTDLMIDEKARTPQAVLDLIRERAADRINIHANWAGGFQAGLHKAHLAWAGGMTTMIGSTYYLGPGVHAYVTLASVLPGNVPCEQVPMVVYDMKTYAPDPYEIRDGKIFARRAPGLGIHPDLDAIDGITVKREVIS